MARAWMPGLVLLLWAVGITGLLAADATQEKSERVRQGLALHLPDLQPDSVSPSPVPGLYEVVVGPRVIYVTEDARFVLRGDVIDLEERRNITQPRVDQLKVQAIERVGEENMLIFSPKKTRYTVTVFTDIDCGFCRKLHKQMAEYNDLGIRVRYLFYPRAGLGSASYRKAVSVWCAGDSRRAMTEAKSGKPIEGLECSNPVQSHMALGELMGVTGTPVLVLGDGRMLPGYVPPEKLDQILREQGSL
ncbi:MAG: DsbC family protein [Sedimenticola sp.]